MALCWPFGHRVAIALHLTFVIPTAIVVCPHFCATHRDRIPITLHTLSSLHPSLYLPARLCVCTHSKRGGPSGRGRTVHTRRSAAVQARRCTCHVASSADARAPFHYCCSHLLQGNPCIGDYSVALRVSKTCPSHRPRHRPPTNSASRRAPRPLPALCRPGPMHGISRRWWKYVGCTDPASHTVTPPPGNRRACCWAGA